MAGLDAGALPDPLRLRRRYRLGSGRLDWLDGGPGVLAFDVTGGTGEAVRVVANTRDTAVPLPDGLEVLVSSGRLPGGQLPPDCAVWLARP